MKLPSRIRQSFLERAKCLYRLHQTETMGVAEETTDFAVRGSHTHLLLKRYVDHLVATNQSTDWDYADKLVEEGSWHEEAIKLFKGWVERKVLEPGKVFGTELQLRLNSKYEPCSDDDPDCSYSSDLDRLDIDEATGEVVDYKTYFLVSEPKSIQSYFYPWMVWKTFPHLQTIKFTIDFVRYPGVERTREFTLPELKRAEQVIEEQVGRLTAAYEADEWPATVNAGCSYCRLECPLVAAGMNRLQVGQIRTEAEAQQLGQEMFALARQYRQLHAILKNYAIDVGQIDCGNDIKLGYRLAEKLQYDARVIQNLNAVFGFAKDRALVVNPREVKKIGQSYPEYEDEARRKAKNRSTTAFKFWHEQGDDLNLEVENEDDESIRGDS